MYKGKLTYTYLMKFYGNEESVLRELLNRSGKGVKATIMDVLSEKLAILLKEESKESWIEKNPSHWDQLGDFFKLL